MVRQNRYNYLIVDDEFPIVKIISDIITIHPNTIKIYTANDGLKALEIFEKNPIDIVICDILMPKMSGIDLIKAMKEKNPDIHIIVVSGLNNIDMVRQAMRIGAYDYIMKPFSVDEIMFSVNRVIDRLKLLEEKENYVLSLKTGIAEATASLRKSFYNALSTLMNIQEARYQNRNSHFEKMVDYSLKLAEKLRLDSEKQESVKIGCILHDIGFIGISDFILMKTTALTNEEYKIIRTHTVLGKKIIEPIASHNQDILDIVLYHHERIDGSGYPEGLTGNKIPLLAKMAAITDAFDAMTSYRVYRETMSVDRALEEIKACAGSQFDPELSREFIALF